MRIILPALFTLSQASMNDSEACQFVGIRLFKAHTAACQDNVCRIQILGGRVVELPCDATTPLAVSILENRSVSDAGNKRKRADEDLLDALEESLDSICNGLYTEMLSDEQSTKTLADDMQHALGVLSHMAADWGEWNTVHRPALAQRESVARLLGLSRSLIPEMITRTKGLDHVISEMGPVANFYFDVLAFLGNGPVAGGSWQDDMMAFLAQAGDPVYRWRHPRELTFDVPPMTVGSDELEKDVIKGLTSLVTDGSDPRIRLAVSFVARADAQSLFSSASFKSHIVLNICPNLTKFAERMTLITEPYDLVQHTIALLRLIQLCRYSHDAQTVKVNVILGSLLFDGSREEARLPANNEERFSFFSSETPKSWPLESWSGEQARAELQGLVDAFFKNAAFDYRRTAVLLFSRCELEDRFEEFYISLGRVLAVALRMRLDVSNVNFPSYLPDRLQRLDVVNTELYLADELGIQCDAFDCVYEPMHFIHRGAIEVLGPASFSAVRRSILERKFQSLED